MYKFAFEKYRGKNSRFACPSCGISNEFTRYVDTETQEYVDETVGICNRKSKCGYHYSPRQFFDENPALYPEQLYTRPKRKYASVKVAEPEIFDCIDENVFRQTLAAGYERNDFVEFLFSRFDRAKTMEVLAKYSVGTWIDGRTVFWQIDQQNRIRTGKLIGYNSATGKRVKNSTNWVHAQLKRAGLLAEEFTLKQCFFGEHLLSTDRQKPIGIVESEKTAILASITLPSHIWLAVGGKTNLSADKFSQIKQRKIFLFPDGDAFSDWKTRAQELEITGFDIQVSDLIEQSASAEEKEAGFDLGDLLIRADENKRFDEDIKVLTTPPINCPVCKTGYETRESRALKIFSCPSGCLFEHLILKPESDDLRNEFAAQLTSYRVEAMLDAFDELKTVIMTNGFSVEKAQMLAVLYLLPRWFREYGY